MLFLVLDPVCHSRVIYLVVLTPIPDSVLMPDVLGSPSPDMGIECMPTRLKRLVPCLVFRDVFPELKLGRYFVPFLPWTASVD